MLALDILEKLIESAPVQFTYRVAELLPVISEAMWDTKKEVKTRAYKAMYVVFSPDWSVFRGSNQKNLESGSWMMISASLAHGFFLQVLTTMQIGRSSALLSPTRISRSSFPS